MSRLTYKEEWEDEVGIQHHYYSRDNACLEKLGKLEDLEEILKNGFIENDRYHQIVFLAYINNDWVICDYETKEKFSLKEVI